MNNELSTRNPRACRACDNVRGNKEIRTGIFECAKCEALFGQCYLGDSYAVVKPQMAGPDVPSERQRYFDFTTLGSKGVGRRHGWFDKESRLITQVG